MSAPDFSSLARAPLERFSTDESALLTSRKRPHELEMDSPRKRRREEVEMGYEERKDEGKDGGFTLSPLLNRGEIIACNTVMMGDDSFQHTPDLALGSKGETTPGG